MMKLESKVEKKELIIVVQDSTSQITIDYFQILNSAGGLSTLTTKKSPFFFFSTPSPPRLSKSEFILPSVVLFKLEFRCADSKHFRSIRLKAYSAFSPTLAYFYKLYS